MIGRNFIVKNVENFSEHLVQIILLENSLPIPRNCQKAEMSSLNYMLITVFVQNQNPSHFVLSQYQSYTDFDIKLDEFIRILLGFLTNYCFKLNRFNLE